jgi:hypothetical protein
MTDIEHEIETTAVMAMRRLGRDGARRLVFSTVLDRIDELRRVAAEAAARGDVAAAVRAADLCDIACDRGDALMAALATHTVH